MYVVTSAESEPSPVLVPEGLRYGIPCVFKGCSGFYHPAGGTVGIVMCSPWGYEELTLRKSWRLLAEQIAQAGFPCIRFDYPCTGNSLGDADEAASADLWVSSIDAAADMLRLNSGVRRFIFVGQSLGATLAVEAARRRADVAALLLIAPVVKGRAYVRELAGTARLVADRIGIALEHDRDDGLSVVGFKLPAGLVDSLKTFDLTKLDRLDVADVTLFDQADRKAAAELLVHLRTLTANVRLEAVEPFHVMVSDATVIQPLPVSNERIIAALRAVHPASPSQSAVSLGMASQALAGPGFREDPVHFGRERALFGMLCRPETPKPGAPAIILLNRGLNPHVGWRRSSVEQARGLAAEGIASLRFDLAGLGESRDEPGREANLIYSDALLPDIAAAVDLLAARGHRRIALAGVCSGAFMALAAANADPRVTDVFVVNTQRFLWNPAESVEEVIRYGLRSMNDYVGDIKGRQALKKLLRSRQRIVPAVRFLARRNLKTLVAKVPIGLRSAVMRNSMAARIHAMFTTLAERGTRVSLLYSEGDPGLVELRNSFGPQGRDLRRFGNVTVALIPDADHNLTSARASSAMLDHIIASIVDEPVAREIVASRFERLQQASACAT